MNSSPRPLDARRRSLADMTGRAPNQHSGNGATVTRTGSQSCLSIWISYPSSPAIENLRGDARGAIKTLTWLEDRRLMNKPWRSLRQPRDDRSKSPTMRACLYGRRRTSCRWNDCPQGMFIRQGRATMLDDRATGFTSRTHGNLPALQFARRFHRGKRRRRSCSGNLDEGNRELAPVPARFEPSLLALHDNAQHLLHEIQALKEGTGWRLDDCASARFGHHRPRIGSCEPMN